MFRTQRVNKVFGLIDWLIDFAVKGHISDHCIGEQNRVINASTPGTIRSPWRPDFYPNNINCVWKIRAPKGKKVKLTFDSFDLASPCGTDFVEVSDITSENTSPRGKYCGNFPDTVSAAEDVSVRFVTDSRGRQKGFVMQYKAVNKGKVNRVRREVCLMLSGNQS